jgi:hypothetical protein
MSLRGKDIKWVGVDNRREKANEKGKMRKDKWN